MRRAGMVQSGEYSGGSYRCVQILDRESKEGRQSQTTLSGVQ